ncbi:MULTISPECIES: EamA family transporter [Cyanophyceae]|uniref:EamA family transporter n=1 Tax=Leptolyngbya subtilissima DQ-A4 TaxID=2933933 RepID=A0ABV0K7D1_9CYAN|nr:EamA family transporter [Nodosilinea sp. FACHB-141]
MLPNSWLPKSLLPTFNPPAPLLVIAAMASTQLGSTLAKSLFGQVGPLGMVLLRVGLSAVVLVAWCRPRWRGHRPADYRLLVVFGLSLAVMNALFYGAIARIPIGVAVALEFSGPLAVALLHSRRWLDGLWVALAAVGIVLLSPLNTPALDSWGVVMALLAGVAWGSYIVLSARMGQAFRGGEGLALSMAVGALLLLPVGIAAEGRLLLSPHILLLGLGVAMLASTLPYSLEMTALRRMPVNVFGVLMSLEPAIAAVISFFWLGETLSLTMIGAIGLVTLAAAGVSLSQPATKAV